MEVNTEANQQAFRPFTVLVKFNSREEALRWSTMLSFNLSIPDLVFDAHVEHKDARETLTREMTLVREAIAKHL